MGLRLPVRALFRRLSSSPLFFSLKPPSQLPTGIAEGHGERHRGIAKRHDQGLSGYSTQLVIAYGPKASRLMGATTTQPWHTFLYYAHSNTSRGQQVSPLRGRVHLSAVYNTRSIHKVCHYAQDALMR